MNIACIGTLTLRATGFCFWLIQCFVRNEPEYLFAFNNVIEPNSIRVKAIRQTIVINSCWNPRHITNLTPFVWWQPSCFSKIWLSPVEIFDVQHPNLPIPSAKQLSSIKQRDELSLFRLLYFPRNFHRSLQILPAHVLPLELIQPVF